jgi:hypothetical protein
VIHPKKQSMPSWPGSNPADPALAQRQRYNADDTRIPLRREKRSWRNNPTRACVSSAASTTPSACTCTIAPTTGGDASLGFSPVPNTRAIPDICTGGDFDLTRPNSDSGTSCHSRCMTRYYRSIASSNRKNLGPLCAEVLLGLATKCSIVPY